VIKHHFNLNLVMPGIRDCGVEPDHNEVSPTFHSILTTNDAYNYTYSAYLSLEYIYEYQYLLNGNIPAHDCWTHGTRRYGANQ